MLRVRAFVCWLFGHDQTLIGASLYGDQFFCERCLQLSFDPLKGR